MNYYITIIVRNMFHVLVVEAYLMFFFLCERIYLYVDKQRWSLTIKKQLDPITIYLIALQKKNTSPQGTTCYCFFYARNCYYSIFRLLSRCLIPHIDIYFISHSFRQYKAKKIHSLFNVFASV